MTTLSRRTFLATVAASTTVSALPALSFESGSNFIPWEAEVKALFEVFDTCDFSPEERCRALYIHPLETPVNDSVIRNVLHSTLDISLFKQDRVNQILTIGWNLEVWYGSDVFEMRSYLESVPPGYNGKTLRALITSGDLGDLRTVSYLTHLDKPKEA